MKGFVTTGAGQILGGTRRGFYSKSAPLLLIAALPGLVEWIKRTAAQDQGTSAILSVIGWIIFGLIAGAIARFLHPGYDRMGIGGTIILGILGSLLGGGIAYVLRLGVSPYQPGGWILSIIGAIILLSIGVIGTPTRRL